MTEREAMTRALALALEGWGRVAPNPLAGCVLLRDGSTIGEGFHAEYGGRHAEVAAVASCGDPAGATCVVTLEPCNHHGKTPPCTDALIAAGVRRVVAALADPTPDAGGGADVLRAAGLEVSVGLMADEAAAINAPFLWHAARPNRPFVAVKLATSLDGYIADQAGRSRWISGPEARDYVHWLRAGFDAIAVGARTAAADDPELTVRGRVTPRKPPLRVVFADRRIPRADLRVFLTAGEFPTVLVCSRSAGPEVMRALSGTGTRVLPTDGLEAALEALAADGVLSVLVEGGGRLAGSLLAEGLADRFYWIQAPLLLGRGVPAFPEGPPRLLGDAPRWRVVERQSLGEDTLIVVDRALCLPES